MVIARNTFFTYSTTKLFQLFTFFSLNFLLVLSEITSQKVQEFIFLKMSDSPVNIKRVFYKLEKVSLLIFVKKFSLTCSESLTKRTLKKNYFVHH